MTKIQQKIKFESERDLNFADNIRQMPGCEELNNCIQCGTCSGTCPLSLYMDLTPRKVIYLARAGFSQDVLKSLTIWLCASCYSCTVECPKEIKITDIMYTLKQKAIQQKVYPKRFPIPVLAKEFFAMVRRFGRTNENWLATLMFLKTNWLGLIKMSGLGMKLFFTGRMSLMMDKIKNREQLKILLGDKKQ